MNAETGAYVAGNPLRLYGNPFYGQAKKQILLMKWDWELIPMIAGCGNLDPVFIRWYDRQKSKGDEQECLLEYTIFQGGLDGMRGSIFLCCRAKVT